MKITLEVIGTNKAVEFIQAVHNGGSTGDTIVTWRERKPASETRTGRAQKNAHKEVHVCGISIAFADDQEQKIYGDKLQGIARS